MRELFDWGRLLAHLTEMVRAAHPPAVVASEPKQQARVLVGLLGAPFAECKAVQVAYNIATVTEVFQVRRAGDYRIILTQMGNVPVVLSSIELGGVCLLRGASIGAELVVKEAQANQNLILEFRALWWA